VLKLTIFKITLVVQLYNFEIVTFDSFLYTHDRQILDNILARSPKSKTKKMVQNRRRVYRLLARKKAISEPYRLLSGIEN
jgi:hypothetical protein